MANPRPTFQQRLFSDEDLPLPLHDQIVRWADLALKKRLHPILDALSIKHVVDDDGFCRAWGDPTVWDDIGDHDHILRRAAWDIARRIAPPLPYPPLIRVDNIKWEPILKDERGTIIGAVDLVASLKIEKPVLNISSESIYKRDNFGWATAQLREASDFLVASPSKAWINGNVAPIVDTNPALSENEIGLVCTMNSIRLVKKCYWEGRGDYQSNIVIYVEAKTKIRTAGELLRQINLYKSAARSGAKFLVVAPASAWEPDMREILHEQGVATLNYMAN
jgi:hypothetical protein